MSNDLLVYHRTAGYYHESIPTALEVISTFPYNLTASDDPRTFSNYTYLSSFAAIVFLSNSDEILDIAEQKSNLESFLVEGGGLVGIHSASAALFSTPYYGTAFGAFFDYHPTLQNATFQVLNDSHPSTSQLPSSWNFVEEVYNFKSDPRATNVSLLLTVDQESYQDSNKAAASARQGLPHPIAWCREGGLNLGNDTMTNGMNATNGTTVEQGMLNMPGRMWYTSLGHTTEIWLDPLFQSHIKGGIDYVLNITDGTAGVVPSSIVFTPIASATGRIGSFADANTGGGQTMSGMSYSLLLLALLCSICFGRSR